ncbi:hypothetical protein V6x_02200 [Gimesia chilikensis]|uniref:Carboxypeptidase regulatory-like domain-containing protein n=1 Tax=Gimesia chilikensis TaxID=2605989 RepID=A0A517W5L3_9PLAN|nr:hypothetical protein V6x_02200 [Gimesia chilikensis]
MKLQYSARRVTSSRYLKRLWLILLLSLSCGWHAGCQSEPDSGQSVVGRVFVEGAPLEHGVITLRPLQGTPGPKVVAAVRDGEFQIPAEQGPWPGKFEVLISATPSDVQAVMSGASHEEIRKRASEPPRIIASPKQGATRQHLVVKAGESMECEFHLKWAPVR